MISKMAKIRIMRYLQIKKVQRETLLLKNVRYKYGI